MSSFTKLFPLLLLVWNYDLPSSASAVSWAVIINNVAALEILLDCGYVRAALLAAVGAVCRAGVGWVSLVFFLILFPLLSLCWSSRADVLHSVFYARWVWAAVSLLLEL